MDVKRYVPTQREAELLTLLNAALHVIERLAKMSPVEHGDGPVTVVGTSMDMILDALERTYGEQKSAARLLGLTERQFNHRLKKLKLRHSDNRERFRHERQNDDTEHATHTRDDDAGMPYADTQRLHQESESHDPGATSRGAEH